MRTQHLFPGTKVPSVRLSQGRATTQWLAEFTFRQRNRDTSNVTAAHPLRSAAGSALFPLLPSATGMAGRLSPPHMCPLQPHSCTGCSATSPDGHLAASGRWGNPWSYPGRSPSPAWLQSPSQPFSQYLTVLCPHTSPRKPSRIARPVAVSLPCPRPDLVHSRRSNAGLIVGA